MPHLHLGSIHSINSAPPGKISFCPSPSSLPPTPPSYCPLPSAVPPPSRPPLPNQCLTFIWDQYIRSIPPPQVKFPSALPLPPSCPPPLPTVPSLPPSPPPSRPPPQSMPHLHLGSIHLINSAPQVKFPCALPLHPSRPPSLPPSPPLPCPPSRCLTFIWDQYIRSI